MKQAVILCIGLISLFGFSQNMNNEKLEEIYTSTSDSIQGRLGAWQFAIKDVQLISLTDESHNRMRIISPITESKTLSEEILKAAMLANFHSALDVKYAISDGVLWSVFIHPLKELSEEQVIDAIGQVYNANVNFGTTFASTSLIFPGRSAEEQPEEKTKTGLKKKQI